MDAVPVTFERQIDYMSFGLIATLRKLVEKEAKHGSTIRKALFAQYNGL